MMTFLRSSFADTFLFEVNFFSLGGEIKKVILKGMWCLQLKSHKKNDPE